MRTVTVTVVWGLPFPPPIIFLVIATKGGRLSFITLGRPPFCSVCVGEGLPTVDRKTTTTTVPEFVHAELAGVLTTDTSHLHTKEFADGKAHTAAVCPCTQLINYTSVPNPNVNSADSLLPIYACPLQWCLT
jgi:hypothetical protein